MSPIANLPALMPAAGEQTTPIRGVAGVASRTGAAVANWCPIIPPQFQLPTLCIFPGTELSALLRGIEALPFPFAGGDALKPRLTLAAGPTGIYIIAANSRSILCGEDIAGHGLSVSGSLVTSGQVRPGQI